MGYPLMTLWPIWVIALVFALAGRNESASILAALPWWHRAIGAAAAVAFLAGYLERLIGALTHPNVPRRDCPAFDTKCDTRHSPTSTNRGKIDGRDRAFRNDK
jgi:hypothetical protein